VVGNVFNGLVLPFKGPTYNGSIATGDFAKISTAIMMQISDDPIEKQRLFDNYVNFSKSGKCLEYTAFTQLAVAAALITTSLWPQEREAGKEDEATPLDNAAMGLTFAYTATNILTVIGTHVKVGEAKRMVRELAQRPMSDAAKHSLVDDDWKEAVSMQVSILEQGKKLGKTGSGTYAAATEKFREAQEKGETCCWPVGCLFGAWETLVEYSSRLGGKQLVDCISSCCCSRRASGRG